MQETFLTEFEKRGYFSQCTDHSGLDELMSKGKIMAYIGFDCTAPSLHVGSLLQIMCLRLLQKYGHQPIVLLGGGTTLIGDPSGKEETRKILSKKEIDKNIKSIEDVFKIFLKSKNSKTKPIFVNNYSWLSKLNYINFLREIGKHFTINKMLTFDSVKLRLEREQSLSYMEFNYMMLQAYDFFELNKRHKCILQIGGSDQWGNIVNGTDLIKRKEKKLAYGLTTPLLTLASGAKMGKTEKGAIWLNKKMLSPYDYWQFWRNTDDKDVINFLKLFTDIDLEQIESLISSNQNINKLKVLLANETTTMLHGSKTAKDSELTAQKTFGDKSIGKNLPIIKIKKNSLVNGMNILDLVLLTPLANSKGEIRRLINNNGLKINNETVSDETIIIDQNNFDQDNNMKVSHGKKQHLIVKII
ncbi:MAG: tyrosine--tRNA ligase [Pelagibacteraceae bacterium]|nr:tyrosine--tRNA ligase [Pelagibacteraceae bacterium]|tara:strand:+ start:1762 stop:3003 length:1242 start_codon:yes stop_codon:yes gene_type:complete